MLAYRLLRSLLRLLCRVFFRQVEVVGLEHVPAEGEGAVIFAGNHPNSLLDPVLVIAFSGRVVHFAAKDVLFQSRLLRVVLKGLGAVPIARKADHKGESLDNAGAFDALCEVLGRGSAMGIFPEGLSHDAPQLSQLRTGAARIAMRAMEQYPAQRLTIVPCGLTYIHRRRFRSRVLLQFGPPLEVEAAATAEEPREAVKALTERIERGLRALTVNAPDWETLRVLDGVRRLYQPDHIAIEDRVELARRFNQVYPTVQDQPEVRALYTRVEEYLDRLRSLGLDDRDLRRQLGPGEAVGRLLHHLGLALVWAPLAVPGLVLHAPAGMLAAWAGQRLTPRKDVIATTKLIAGLLSVALLYLALAIAAGLQWGWPWAVAILAVLPLTGLATVRLFDRGMSIGRWAKTLTRFGRLREELDWLRKERAALEQAVLGAVERFRPPEMVLLFPRAKAGAADHP